MLSNPFKADIYPDGWPASGGNALMHRTEWDQLLTMLEGQRYSSGSTPEQRWEGRVVLLKAPRAGFGKSHLLAALTEKVSKTTLVVAPTWETDREMRWTDQLGSCLATAHNTEIGVGKLTQIDSLARQLFGMLNAELIRGKIVPCANPDAAISALQKRSLELFDLHDARQAVGKWFADHFERLLPITSSVLARNTGIAQDAAVTWLRALCAYTQETPEAGPAHLEQLRWALQQGDGAGRMSGGMQILTAPKLDENFGRDRLVEFLRIASLDNPVLLVFDHLDAVHGQPLQTMRVASVICEFRRLLPRALIILSANQDIWSGSFQKYLPSAMEDRLTEEWIELKELNAEQGLQLLRWRLRSAGVSETESHAFLSTLAFPHADQPRSGPARTILRHAARAWESWIHRPQPEPATPPATGNRDEESDLPNFSSLLTQAPSGTSFQQLKSMLEKLRTDRSIAGKLTFTRPETAAVTSLAHDQQGDIQTQFQQLRERLLGAKPLRIDQDLLCHLLDVCGKRLAVVKASHVPLPGSVGPGVMLWETPDAEILFGTEAHEDRPYWQALLAFARQKYVSGILPHPHLAIFSASQEPVDLAAWLGNDAGHQAQLTYVDVVSLDPDSLATLYAADELLHSAEHTPEGGRTPDEIFAALSPIIEPFWKRLTRVRPLL